MLPSLLRTSDLPSLLHELSARNSVLPCVPSERMMRDVPPLPVLNCFAHAFVPSGLMPVIVRFSSRSPVLRFTTVQCASVSVHSTSAHTPNKCAFWK